MTGKWRVILRRLAERPIAEPAVTRTLRAMLKLEWVAVEADVWTITDRGVRALELA